MKNRMYIIVFILGSILISSSFTSVKLDNKKSRLEVKLDEVASYVSVWDSKNPEVSEATVSWHIDHICLVINQVFKTVEQSEESNYKTKFNLIRAYVFAFNSMPRGKVTAPESVRPKDNIDINTFQMHYDQALTSVEKLSKLPKNKHFNHPVLGTMNRDKIIKFLTIHTEHHLKIIRDILK